MAKILLIEDNPDISFIYKDALLDASHVVETAADGQTGIDLALNGAFDLILLDLMLPGKHGLQVLQELKGNEKTKDVAVYVLSALSDKIVSDQAENLGADGFFIKSEYGPGDLVEAVSDVLKKIGKA